MEAPSNRETRGKSVEYDGRRINAVPPMHVGESVLQNLLKEQKQQQQFQHIQAVRNPQAIDQNGNAPTVIYKHEDGDRKLQQMLEKYQSQVRLQQQRNPQQQKNGSRSNLKIEKITSMRSPGSGPSNSGNSHMSHSQPCLIAVTTDKPPDYSPVDHRGVARFPHRQSSGSSEAQERDNHSSSTTALTQQHHRMHNSQKLMQSLREENLHLKRDVETMKKKLGRLQQIEQAYDQIEREYESLLREKERQDGLEKQAMVQMELRIKRLMAEKEALHDQLAVPNMQAMEKISQLNMLLGEVIPKNQELIACKERQTMELGAQSATLEEQRKHIALVETALGNAKERLTKREKTCEELSMAAERANVLQRQLHDSLVDKQARDEAHAAERAHWEMEMTQLRMQLNKDASLSGSLKRSTTSGNNIADDTLNKLKKTLYMKDEKITQLERTIVELQRRMHEESERKNCAMGALSDNLEMKIKQLQERNSEKDRRIAELTEEREKLGDILDGSLVHIGRDRALSSATCGEERARELADLQKMEQMRHRIQERKRKGRPGAPTGGLMGMGEHSRSSSGSLLQTSSHHKTSSGPYDGHLDTSGMGPDLSMFTNSGSSKLSNGLPYTNIVFRGEKQRENDDKRENSWNI